MWRVFERPANFELPDQKSDKFNKKQISEDAKVYEPADYSREVAEAGMPPLEN